MTQRTPDTKTAAQRHVTEGRANSTFRLVVTEGPDRGTVFAVPAAASARVLVGQSSACAFRLTDPLVSRRHATVEVQGAHLEITDLDSRNGTFANEVAIARAFLWGGEVVRLGGTTLRVELDEGFVETPLSDATAFGRVVGASVAMRRLYPFFERLAGSALPVIVEGETGTGKELLAEALHETGPRCGGPFVVFDAGQVAADRIERALFGDDAGPGVFEQADGGTLVLDEVGELDGGVQRKLLRVLERSEVQRGGTGAATAVDVRVIATTRLDLDALVQDGVFREDLYYRLLVSRVELPPLRRRRGDVTELARHFWRELGGEEQPSKGLLDALERHPWPGNVRELKNRVARIVTFGAEPDGAAAASIVAESAAPEEALFERVLSMGLPLPRAREMVVAEFEREYVARVLAESGGSVVKAAAASGLARRYFQILRAKRGPRG